MALILKRPDDTNRERYVLLMYDKYKEQISDLCYQGTESSNTKRKFASVFTLHYVYRVCIDCLSMLLDLHTVN